MNNQYYIAVSKVFAGKYFYFSHTPTSSNRFPELSGYATDPTEYLIFEVTEAEYKRGIAR